MTTRRLRLLAVVAAAVSAVAATATADARPTPPVASRPASQHTGDANAAGTSTATAAGTKTGTKAAATDGTTDHCTDGFGGVVIATGLPPTPCLTLPGSGNDRWTDSLLPFDPISQVVAKPKVYFEFPPLLVRGFVLVCANTFPPALACPFDTHLPAPDTHIALGFYGYYGNLWVRSPDGVEPRYGIFPTTTVTTLAFGSIPVKATVHVEQAVDAKGYRMPMELQWLTGYGMVAGAIIPGYEQYGPVPSDGKRYQFYALPHISGRVVIRVSDVTVDGVPLDVGSACETETDLSLTAAAGYHEDTVPPVEGQPGEYSPQGASYLHGTIDVPAFHGCHDGNEDLDPLLTGTVSGPGNHVDVHQTTALQVTGCYFFPSDPNCDTKHPHTSRTYGGLPGSAIAQLSPAMRAQLSHMSPAQLRAATTLQPPK